jgi:integrase
MPRKLPLFVERNHVKGRTYLYFRKDKGPRTRLPNDPTSEEFATAYRALLLGEPVPARPALVRSPHGTISWLIASYMKSADFINLRETSKAGYRSRLETIRNDHGHREVVGLTRKRIIKLLEPYADRPGAALDTLKKLRILIKHAIDIEILKIDPSAGIKRPKIKRIRSWTEAEIETFRQRWPLGSLQRLAFELFLGTGQRRSDVVRMTWSQITPDNKIHVHQQKTGRRLVIPLHMDTIEALLAVKRRHVSILTTAFGKPFTVDGFSQWLRQAISAAGLPLDCQPHGLRKAAGRRLAEAGASTKEVMAILGHTTLSEAERYIEEADQVRLAEGAVIKLEQRRDKSPQTGFSSLGNKGKKERKSTWKNDGWRSLGESNPCFSLERAAS